MGDDPGHRLERRLGPERRLPGRHLVEQDPQREEVRARVDAVAPHLFRRHGAGRAQNLPGRRERGLAVGGNHRPGEAEVEDLHVARRRHHHVLGLEIAVHDALGVRFGQTLGDLPTMGQDDTDGQRTPAAHLLGQGRALDVFHDEPVVAVLVEDVEDLDNGRVREAGDGPRLTAKPCPARSALGVGTHLLDGHPAIKAPIVRLVDGSHAALAEQLVEAVGAEVSWKAGIDRVHFGLHASRRCRCQPCLPREC